MCSWEKLESHPEVFFFCCCCFIVAVFDNVCLALFFCEMLAADFFIVHSSYLNLHGISITMLWINSAIFFRLEWSRWLYSISCTECKVVPESTFLKRGDYASLMSKQTIQKAIHIQIWCTTLCIEVNNVKLFLSLTHTHNEH